MADLQYLPNEVLEQVMTHARYAQYQISGEYDDLRALCLVSHRFADIARRVLYQEVRIFCHGPDLHSKTRLQCLTTILTVPRVATYVRSLRIWDVPGHLRERILGARNWTEAEQAAKLRAASEFLSGSASVVTRKALLDPDHPLNLFLVTLEPICPDVAVANVVEAAVDQARLGIGQEWIEAIQNGELTALAALLLAYLPKLEVLRLHMDFSPDRFLQTAISAKSQLLSSSTQRRGNLSEVVLESYDEDCVSMIVAFGRLASVRTLRLRQCFQSFNFVNDMNLGQSCLTSLHIHTCKFTDVYFANFLRCCTSLQHLHIECTGLYPSEFEDPLDLGTITRLGDALRHAATRSLQTLKISELHGLPDEYLAGTWGSFQRFTQLEEFYMISYDFLYDGAPASTLATALPPRVVSVYFELTGEDDLEVFWQQIKGILAVRQQGVLPSLGWLEVVADQKFQAWTDDDLASLEKTYRDLKGDFEASGVELSLTVIGEE